jgi:hypothetical protein
METFLPVFQNFQLDLTGVLIIGLFLFAFGYWLGTLKSKKLNKKIHKMEKDIMDLNAELLYNDYGSPAKA